MASSYGEGITSNLHVKVGHFHTCALNRVCKRTSRIACVSKAKQCGVHAMSKSLKAMDAFHRTQNWGERTHNSVHKTQARADCRRSLGPCRLQAVLDGKSMEKDVDKRSRVLLKVSGEALAGSLGFGIDPEVVENVAQEVAAAVQEGVQVAIVVGGGNFFRGESAFQRLRIDRASADYMGMLATVMNALSLQSALECQGIQTRVQSAIEMKEVAEPYIRRRAIRHLERGRVVIFGAGTGNPFFTTDTCAALRAAEVGASCVLKATKVDGVYDEDPTKNPNAKLIPKLSFAQIENEKKIAVMDKTAVTLCRENNIPVVVFNIKRKGALTEVVKGSTEIGTTIT